MTSNNRKYFIFLLLSILIIIPIGFYSKFYEGPARTWVNNSLGGFFYEIFWILLLALILPKTRPVVIAFSVFIFTSVLEIMQLWHPPVLEYFRSFFLGKTILGNCFVWSDFLYYFVGSVAGFFWIRAIKKAP